MPTESRCCGSEVWPSGPAASVVGTGVASTSVSADPTDYPIIGGDQASGQLIVFDPSATDRNSPSAIERTWLPTSAEGFSSNEISATRWSDFKLRKGSSRLVVTGAQPGNVAQYDMAAIVDWTTGHKIWATLVPYADNLHSAELLPRGLRTQYLARRRLGPHNGTAVGS